MRKILGILLSQSMRKISSVCQNILPFFAFVLFFTSNVSAQDFTYEQLEGSFAMLNSQMPMSLGNGLEMTSVSINREEVTFRYMINDIGDTMSNISFDDPNIKDRIKSMLTASVSDDMVKNMYISIANLGLKMKLQMTGENTGKTIDIIFSPEEVMDIAMSPIISPIEWVKAWYKNFALQLPLSMGIGLTLQNIILTDSMMQYVCLVDESIVSFDTMLANKKNVRESICNLLFSRTDALVIMQNTQMALAGLSLSYKYVSSQSSKSFSIDFSNQELKNKMQLEPSEIIDSVEIFEEVDSIAVE